MVGSPLVLLCDRDEGEEVPVDEYLRPQKRFAHLFAEGNGGASTGVGTDALARIQAQADHNIRRFGLLDERTDERPGERTGEQTAA